MSKNTDAMYTILMLVVTTVIGFIGYDYLKKHDYFGASIAILVIVWNTFWLIRNWYTHEYTLSDNVKQHPVGYGALLATYIILITVLYSLQAWIMLYILYIAFLINVAWLVTQDTEA